jgi:hypothetical protein
MSRSIVLPVRRSDPFLRAFGAAMRRLELERVGVRHAAPEMGIAFEPVSVDFSGLPDNTFQGGILYALKQNLSPEQTASLCLLEDAAAKSGFAIGQKDQDHQRETALCVVVKPSESFGELLGTSFGETKALPPASEDLDPISQMLRAGRKERARETVLHGKAQ